MVGCCAAVLVDRMLDWVGLLNRSFAGWTALLCMAVVLLVGSLVHGLLLVNQRGRRTSARPTGAVHASAQAPVTTLAFA